MSISSLSEETIELEPLIHHAVLDPFLDEESLGEACTAAKALEFSGLCTHPIHISKIRDLMGERSKTKVIAVIAFPFGCIPRELKRKEAEWCIEKGAEEIEVVPNFFAIKEGKYEKYAEEIADLCEIGIPARIILDYFRLSKEELTFAIEGAIEAGAIGLQSGNGFGPKITPEVIHNLSGLIKSRCEIKAVGGIRTVEDALGVIQSGASYIGTSLGPQLIKAFRNRFQ
tara:strand:+ start:25 stop:708 length:684 start_codon:yes stop_codon:yes gene_type:complete